MPQQGATVALNQYVMILPQPCHFDFPHVSAELFICIYMNTFNSLGCCWELKPLENPIFRQKRHENKKIQTPWDLFWRFQGLRVPVAPGTVPTPFWEAPWWPCLCRASKKSVSLTDFLQCRRCCRLAFLPLGSVSC